MNQIEYHTEYKRVEKMGSDSQMMWNGKRKRLTETYAWAIPNQKAIEYIVDLSPIVEIGSGSGYWAYEIDKYGGDVDCFDSHPQNWNEEWYPVEKATVDEVAEIETQQDKTLFLCWPPANASMAFDAVDMLSPTDVVFIGEWANEASDGHVNGDSQFYDKMKTWNLASVIDIPQWKESDDKLYHFTNN